jgi:hypothetical protein
MIFTVAEVLWTPENCEGDIIREHQQRCVQTKLDGLFKPALLRSETSTTSESSIDEYE